MIFVSLIDQHLLHDLSIKKKKMKFSFKIIEQNTLRRVVIANVAIDRFESVINVSRSTLQVITDAGY